MVVFKVVICALFAVTGAAAAGCGFGYEGDHGNDWGDEYEQCSGKHQSPINIDSEHVTRINLPPLKMKGFSYTSGVATLTNNGHTAMMTTDSKRQPLLTGGPLNGTYEFAQLHFHWGSEDDIGSEDEIDGKSYAMEMHFVFFKKEYLNSDAALAYSDGLCVLAIFFEVGDIHNPNFDGFTKVLEEIIEPETSATFDVAPALIDLLPDDYTHYFTYFGSLTTPPCAEVVTWIDFKHPVKLSHDQFQGFRNLLNEEENSLSNNFRSIQPIGDRVVFYNINHDELVEHLKGEVEAGIEKLKADTEALVAAAEGKATSV